MQDVQPSLFARPDTLLGVCQGIGEDLGINPFWPRMALIPVLFFYPVETIGVYLAAGAVVLLSRLIFPAQVRIAVEPVAAQAIDSEMEADSVRLAA